MGAVLGIAAFGRTQEKLGGANNGGAQVPAAGSASGFTAPSAPSTGFGSTSGGFGSQPLGGNSASSFTPAPSWGTTPVSTGPAVVTGFGGKPAPVQPDQPQI